MMITYFVKTQVQDFITNLDQVVGDSTPGVYKLHELVVAHHIPDAVTREHDKFVVRSALVIIDLERERDRSIISHFEKRIN